MDGGDIMQKDCVPVSFLPPSRCGVRAKKRWSVRMVAVVLCAGVLLASFGLLLNQGIGQLRLVRDGEITVAQMLSSLGDWLAGRPEDQPEQDATQEPTPAPESRPTAGEEGELRWEHLYAFDRSVLSADEIGLRPMDLWSEDYDTTAASFFEKETAAQEIQGPLVLIVHSHASEAYSEQTVCSYKATQTFGRSSSKDLNVVGVGEVLARELERQGVSCLTLTTAFDEAGNAGAFERAAEAIAILLEQYPSIRYVIDVHRGAQTDGDGQLVRPLTYLGQEEAAQIKLIATPRYRDRAFASACGRKLNQSAHHVCYAVESTDVGQSWYYEDVLVLRVEIGTVANTPAQARRSACALAESLAACIK